MSILGNEEKIVNDLTSKIKHEEITSALLFLSDRGCLCVNGNDGIIIDGTYYEIYRTDKLLRVDMDNAPYGGQYKEYLILDRIDVDNIPAEIYNGQVHMQANIQPYYKSLFVSLEHRPLYNRFTTNKIFIEDEELIVEPTHKTAPILIKNLKSADGLPKVTFRCPEWYRGYVLAVDCDPQTTSELFNDFMIIHEHSIVQTI